MPKSNDKTKGAKKRPKSLTSAEINTGQNNDCGPGAKKKKIQKRSGMEGIEKSKQLKERLKRPYVSRSTIASRNKESKLCGNGRPMPSLSELEMMYEDSDSDDDPPEIKPSAPQERCATPETKPDTKTDGETLLSPNTLKKIASRVLDMISNATEDDGSTPPVIPRKKPNKSGIPFIVGCKDREQVAWAPKTSFCKGSPTYGVEEQDDEECKGENIGPHYASISKSIFNAQSEEIAERLKELDRFESLGIKPELNAQTAARSGSPDSNKTVPYDLPDSPKSMPRSFSPLPSTSKDSETILKNDQLFNQSLKCESVHSNSTQEDVEIVEVPCETIIIDDNVPDRSKPEPMDVDIDPEDVDDDCCVIVESRSNMNCEQSSDGPIEFKDEIYGGLDLTQSYDENEVCEVIDVDDIISENIALLDKYRRESNSDSVILVEPNTTTTTTTQNTSNQDDINNNSPSKEPTQTDSNRPVLATEENANSQPIHTTTEHVEVDRNEIGNVVTNFFRRTMGNDPRNRITVGHCNNTDDNTFEITVHRTVEHIPVSSNATQNTISRILSWLTTIPCRNLNIRTRRRRTVKRSSRQSAQTNRFSSERIAEPRPMTSTEVSDILTQALASANQQHAEQQQQDQELSPHQHSPQQQPMDNGPKSLGDCPICMDNLSNNAIASTLCGHIFCMKCIKTAIRANGKRCPTCRKALKGVGYHQLFL